MKKYIRIAENDNVIIALEPFIKGDMICDFEVLEDINIGHKMAATDILAGEDIIKYGHKIGRATTKITKGSWVHVHNVETNLGEIFEYQYQPLKKCINVNLPAQEIKVFHRKNGEVGIRNELWVIPTVGCINALANRIVEKFKEDHSRIDIDGIFAYTHPYGCSQMGDDLVNTRETLQNIVTHPNAGGVLVIGLGCENNLLSTFKDTLQNYDLDRVKFLNFQSVDDEVESSIAVLNELYELMKTDKREVSSLSKIRIGLKCGGSDGLSGITANPLLGRLSDYIIHHHGSMVLTEIPEMFGAETILMEKCESEEVFYNYVKLINDFKGYYQKHNQVIYENPSPGNKAGGITTLEDKSLGCIQKGGNSQIVDILNHTEKIKKNGLSIISAPGNDLVSTTTLGMSGCQLVLFTTGRGTPFGGFIPTLKVSSNNELAAKKPHWIDFNAGNFASDTADVILKDFVDLIYETINGKKTKNEINNLREIAVFKNGVTL